MTGGKSGIFRMNPYKRRKTPFMKLHCVHFSPSQYLAALYVRSDSGDSGDLGRGRHLRQTSRGGHVAVRVCRQLCSAGAFLSSVCRV